jgi:hypothetical protein
MDAETWLQRIRSRLTCSIRFAPGSSLYGRDQPLSRMSAGSLCHRDIAGSGFCVGWLGTDGRYNPDVVLHLEHAWRRPRGPLCLRAQRVVR